MKGDPEIDEYMKDVSPRLLEVFRVDGKTSSCRSTGTTW